MGPGGSASPKAAAGRILKWVDEKEKADQSAGVPETPPAGVTAVNPEATGKGRPKKWKTRRGGATWWKERSTFVGAGKPDRGKGGSKGKSLPRKGGSQLAGFAKSKGKGKRG